MAQLPVRAKAAAIGPSSSAASYAKAEKAESTRAAYRADFLHFEGWALTLGQVHLPTAPGLVADYIAHLADSGLKAATIGRRLSAIGYAHRLAGHPSPTDVEGVKATLRGIRRTIGTAPERKSPITAKLVKRVLGWIPDTLAGARDRAIILIGFAAALRRSELVALDVVDIERVDGGIVLTIRQSKTDQEARGQTIAIPHGRKLKPVAALDAWLFAAQITEGPIFRPIGKGGRLLTSRLTDKSVANIVKQRAGAAGLDPEKFAGHSLRAGFVTTALERGADPFRIMDTTRHARIDTLRVYDRRAKQFKDHAGDDFL